MKCDVCGRARVSGNTDRYWLKHVERCRDSQFECPGCKMRGSKHIYLAHVKACPLVRICRHCEKYVAQVVGEGQDPKMENDHEKQCGSLVDCKACAAQVIYCQMPFHPCPEGEINCPKCQQKVKRKEMEIHKQTKCPEEIVSCDNKCGTERIKRRDLQIHLMYNCPNRIVQLYDAFRKDYCYCKNSNGSQFYIKACEEKNHYRHNCMESQIAQLQSQVAELQTQVINLTTQIAHLTLKPPPPPPSLPPLPPISALPIASLDTA